MKVREMIEELIKCDPEAEIIVQKDSEGNGYSPCAGVDPKAVYIPDTTWYGTVYDTRWSAGDCCMEEDEWATIKATAQKAVVVYPVN